MEAQQGKRGKRGKRERERESEFWPWQ